MEQRRGQCFRAVNKLQSCFGWLDGDLGTPLPEGEGLGQNLHRSKTRVVWGLKGRGESIEGEMAGLPKVTP